MSITTTSRVEFECGYVYNHEFHAHRYLLEVTVDGPQRLADNNIIIEFESLNQIMVQVVPDKVFLLAGSPADPTILQVAELLAHTGVPTLTLPTADITAEGLLAKSIEDIQKILDSKFPGVRIQHARLRENSNSFVEWRREIEKY